MKLSIVIPVYCVEHTLTTCINSIVNQTFTDWEMLLIDDGSPDASPAICDEWTQRDGRIHVVHQTNGGLSAARNAGIGLARGEYVTFVDSDDYVDPQTYSHLVRLLDKHEQVDIVEYPVVQHEGHPQKELLLTFNEAVYADPWQYWFDIRAYTHTYACNKVYRRALFGDVRFPPNTLFEDVHTLPLLLQRARLVATTGEGLYHYCHNPAGITSRANGQALAQLLEAHLKVLAIPDIGLREGFDDYYANVLNIQLDVYESTGDSPRLPPPPRGNYHPKGWKPRLQTIIGLKRLCQLNQLIHKVLRRNPS